MFNVQETERQFKNETIILYSRENWFVLLEKESICEVVYFQDMRYNYCGQPFQEIGSTSEDTGRGWIGGFVMGGLSG